MAGEFIMDPFYALSKDVEATKTKVADSIFEDYKLQVAQTNEINNRAMQVALNNMTALSNLKSAVSKGTLETMIEFSKTDAAVARNAMATQKTVMEEAERSRELVLALNTQNLNTALINTNTAVIGSGVAYAGLGSAFGGLNSAVQSANTNNLVNAFGSQISRQRVINTGDMTDTTQTDSPTMIRA